MAFVLTLVVGLTLVSCAKDDENMDFHYEVPVKTLFEALNDKDSLTFTRCFATPVLNEYKLSDNYDENIAQNYKEEIIANCDNTDVVLTCKITEKHELDKDEFETLTTLKKDRHKVKTAYALSVRVTAFSTENHSESFSQEIQLVVGKISGNWYICSSPIIDFNLIKNVKGD